MSELRDLLRLTESVAPEPPSWIRGDSAILYVASPPSGAELREWYVGRLL